MEPVLVAANWKMYKTTAQALEFFDQWAGVSIPPGREVAFFPPFPLLGTVREHLPPGQALGAQNAHESDEGAFTGEVSCTLLRDVGCTYVLIGHSERRHVFGETDARIAAKVKAAFRHGLRPVLCVGEKLEEREAGRTLDVVLGQLAAGLSDPVPARRIRRGLRARLGHRHGQGRPPRRRRRGAHGHPGLARGPGAGRDARVLYGGSVKPDNAAVLLATEGVHGLLVGGASLDPKSFADIVKG